jgi:hypothetical protein
MHRDVPDKAVVLVLDARVPVARGGGNPVVEPMAERRAK